MQTQPQSVIDMTQAIGRRRFRFRNVLNLEDYLATDNADQGFTIVVNLDNGQYFQLNSEQKRYTLLSSQEEADYLCSLKFQAAVNIAAEQYAKH